MRTLIMAFSMINIFLCLITAMPCLMAGAMGMDSPQAQASLFAHIICYTVLSFPLVCLVCGVISTFFNSTLGLVISFLPISEAILFVAILYFIGDYK